MVRLRFTIRLNSTFCISLVFYMFSLVLTFSISSRFQFPQIYLPLEESINEKIKESQVHQVACKSCHYSLSLLAILILKE